MIVVGKQIKKRKGTKSPASTKATTAKQTVALEVEISSLDSPKSPVSPVLPPTEEKGTTSVYDGLPQTKSKYLILNFGS